MNTNDLESREAGADTIPVSFKVIGTGSGAADIIEKVESFGYDCVGCVVAESPADCIPEDEDKMAIIVAHDNEDVANEIAKNEPVLYCDFELSDKAFQLRYSDDATGTLYKFPANFKRAEIDPEAMGESVMGADYEDIVVQDIESAAIAHSVKVIIIDNLSWICNASEKVTMFASD